MTESKKRTTQKNGQTKTKRPKSSEKPATKPKVKVQADKPKAQSKKAKTSGEQVKLPVKKEKSLLRYEIELISLFGLSILSAVAIHTNLTGIFGQIMKSVYLGLFGFAGVLLTYVIFLMVFFNINPYFKAHKQRLTLAALCLFASVLLFATGVNYDTYVHVINGQSLDLNSPQALRVAFDQGIDLRGGGILGNLLVEALVSAVGKFGVYLLGTLMMAISVVLTFKVSLTGWVTKGGIKTYQGSKAVAGKLKQVPEQMQQLQQKRQEEQAMALAAKAAEQEATEPKMPIDAFDSDLYFDGDQAMTLDAQTGEYLPLEPSVSELEDLSTPEASFEQAFVLDAEEPEAVVHYIKEELIEPTDFVFHSSMPEGLEAEETAELTFEEPSESDEPLEPFTARDDDLEATTALPVEAPAVQQAVQKPEQPQAPKPLPKPIPKPYVKPPLSLLNMPKGKVVNNREEIAENVKILEATMRSFGVDAKVTEVTKGPAITMYEVLPAPGVKVAKIVNLQDDIALALAASQIRMIAPIPGKSAIGIEIPNKDTTMVTAREVFESEEFKKSDSKLAFALGKDITGRTIIADLAKMPHLLIAGSTGSGKSVCVNTIINSILFNATPEEVKLLMIDPKVVELSHYNGIPHLILPVVVDPKKASIALNWAVNEMTRRYQAFAENMVKDINTYNRKAETQPELNLEKMPKIVVLVDELADLMMVAPNQVEEAICRLAQMARAAGIHLIVATQRPSVDIITGVIKANIPSRIAFAVSSQIDSRTIIDSAGAEKLLGKGDMLFYPLGSNKPTRVQGAFLADQEVEGVVNFVKQQTGEVVYQEEILGDYVEAESPTDADELLPEAIELIIDTGQASISMLQRKFRVGYNRAARLIDQMEARHIVGPSLGSKPREVLLTKLEWENQKNA